MKLSLTAGFLTIWSIFGLRSQLLDKINCMSIIYIHTYIANQRECKQCLNINCIPIPKYRSARRTAFEGTLEKDLLLLLFDVPNHIWRVWSIGTCIWFCHRHKVCLHVGRICDTTQNHCSCKQAYL
jgi:hypothetical protein